MDMSLVTIDSKAAFNTQLQHIIDVKLEKPLSTQVQQLAQSIFDQYPLAELKGRDVHDVFGMTYDSYRFIEQLKPSKPKVRVYNPSLDEDGWLCNHTAVSVLTSDMPFIVDSLRLALGNFGVEIHTLKTTVLTTTRHKSGQLQTLMGPDTHAAGMHKETLVYFEIDRHSKVKDLKAIADVLKDSLADVASVNRDYHAIQERLAYANEQLVHSKHLYADDEVGEVQDFVSWLMHNNFTFLGYAYYGISAKAQAPVLETSLGLLGDQGNLNDFLCDNIHSDTLLTFSKSAVRSWVHRRAYPDHIIIKQFSKSGKLCGEHHVLGLYTSRVYRESVLNIPVVRNKVDAIFTRAGLTRTSYDGKVLRQVLETFLRDELFQSHVDELYHTVMGVAQINERHKVRLFMRKDPSGHFANAIVYIPRDVFSTKLREQVLALLGDAVGATSSEYYTYYSESILARTYMIFRLDKQAPTQWRVDDLEANICDMARSWSDHLLSSLGENYGEERGTELFNTYQKSFSNSYQDHFDARKAVRDIDIIDKLSAENDLAMHFYQPVGVNKNTLCFKVFHWGEALMLSDAIPVLENMGLKVVGEHPYKIRKEGDTVWLHDFELQAKAQGEIDVPASRTLFENAFRHIWQGDAESDAFNGLVLSAQLDWREIVVLRAYAAYMKQTVFPFSQQAIASALSAYPAITRHLIELFHQRFNPELYQQTNSEALDHLITEITTQLDEVSNLNDDRMIRRYLDLIQGTMRTNYYQSIDGVEKPYISFKFSPRDIPDIPEPRPLFEIFVYSPRVEGVHLRGGKVARGGLRWSDRQEDFRTEVLGLVKAQQVKNAVIVPNGAKGGFVAKKASMDAGREAFFNEGVACYQLFIQGLLDITDNFIDNRIVEPVAVVRHDEDDPYLVVAADKGTATFSDIANEISLRYGHWLGDAFASGGSQGYDHKGMGITAKGAWVSVQRHFKEKDINVQQEDFSVIGIGDMAGDVFGNGMLLSEHICLVAAFNHMHIFIDPTPDSAKSFLERKRLFETPRVSWEDYSKALISKGGGIFSRSAKSIAISPEMKACFDIKASKLTPTELITALLKAPVDLIWNGGIGTYVKAQTETHADVGDKANDVLRINGNELRCKVFGEGGNLGLTQLGRIEYCLNGGACNTDFIDNAAGVDCSDHEVNIKILLSNIVGNGDMTEKQRNNLLAKMTDNVAQLVLKNNYQQTQAISLAQMEVTSRIGEYRRLINALESSGRLNRELEFIPGEDELSDRATKGQSLTRPELSVLTSYAKVMLKEELAVDDISNNAYLAASVEHAFPDHLRKKYTDNIYSHILRKEIVATQIANDMVDNMGMTFCHRLMEATGDDAATVAKAYVTARDVYQFDAFREKVQALDYTVPAQKQFALLSDMMRRVRRGTRWFLRNHRNRLNPSDDVALFEPAVKAVIKWVPTVLNDEQKQQWQEKYTAYTDMGLDNTMASMMTMSSHLFSGLGIAEAAHQSGADVKEVVEVHHLLGEQLGLYWFAHLISDVKIDNYWQAMARETFIDDLDKQLRLLSVGLLRLADDRPVAEVLSLWMNKYSSLVERWRVMMHDLQSTQGTDFAMFSVAMRELVDLTQACESCESLPAVCTLPNT